MNLNYSDIEACANSELGTKLQLQMEEESQVIKESGHVPTVTFGGKYNGKDFWDAFSDLYSVIERKLEEIEKNEM
jgi:hypothetical protein